MQSAGKIEKDLVLVGGGHAHVQVVKRFAMRPEPGVRVTLISPDSLTPYSGMLPGLIAGHYDFEATHIDLNRLCRFAGARFIRAAATGFDLSKREVLLKDRPPLAYDVVSIDTGSTPRQNDIPGARDFAIPVKPISNFLVHWEKAKARALSSQGKMIVAVVGAGAGGVELLLAIQHALTALRRKAGMEPCDFALFSRGTLLPAEAPALQRQLRRVLEARRVAIHEHTPIARVERGALISESGQRFQAQEIFWVTAAGAPLWARASGFDTDPEGFIAVDAALQSTSHPGVFAAGDVAAMTKDPRPKAGVFAVRQGPTLANNLRRALRGETLEPFRPQTRFLKILATGPRHAIATRGPWALAGEWVWRWKDIIDRRFMARFNEPGDFQAAPSLFMRLRKAVLPPSPQDIRCAGCGAKIGSQTLSAALGKLDVAKTPGVVVGLDAPDDAAVIALPPDSVAVQSVDAFRAMVDDPYLFGQIAANHALGDLHAMGATPHSALALATLPPHGNSIIERDLFQMMAGAVQTLETAGAALVGGHTAEGAETMLGFSVTGHARTDRLLRKSGMAAGDVLILAKPLGVGALLAADMRGKAAARDTDAALALMTLSNARAVRIFLQHGANACTDVTGFGLAGHALEMAQASQKAVEINPETLPVLSGAREAIARGFTSTAHPQNVESVLAVGLDEWDASAEILFDPQTAGGLLASVPATKGDACVAALRQAGYAEAAIVGRVTERNEAACFLALKARERAS